MRFLPPFTVIYPRLFNLVLKIKNPQPVRYLFFLGGRCTFFPFLYFSTTPLIDLKIASRSNFLSARLGRGILNLIHIFYARDPTVSSVLSKTTGIFPDNIVYYPKTFDFTILQMTPIEMTPRVGGRGAKWSDRATIQ